MGTDAVGACVRPVVTAVKRAAEHGTSFGASTPSESDLAELVQRCFPSMERMRFVIRAQRRACPRFAWRADSPGRPFVIKFEGCYHGHADALLVKAGSGVATFGFLGRRACRRRRRCIRWRCRTTILRQWRTAFGAFPDQIACVIVEPVVGNAGTISPKPGYLAGLRELTRENGALLIFDEVMTGFRLAVGGAQERFAEELGENGRRI